MCYCSIFLYIIHHRPLLLIQGESVVGFAARAPTAVPGGTGGTLTIAGYSPSIYAGGASHGFIKMDAVTSVPVAANSISATGGEVGAWVNDVAIDA